MSIDTSVSPLLPVTCMTVVFEHVDERARMALSNELFERFPMSTDPEIATRMTGFSYGSDAMSVLDCIRDAVNNSKLDLYETIDCIKELVEASTYEEAAAVLREWDLPVPGEPTAQVPAHV